MKRATSSPRRGQAGDAPMEISGAQTFLMMLKITILETSAGNDNY
jgi:hypothetical protein